MSKPFILRIALALPAVCFGILSIAQPPNNKPGPATQVPGPGLPVAPQPASYIVNGVNPRINYVRTREGLGRITDLTAFGAASYSDVMEHTEYSDGLGRTVQKVQRQSSPGGTPADIVEPVVYDPVGREVYRYLPYTQTTGTSTSDGKFKLTPFSDQANFYQNVYPADQPSYTGEQIYYAQVNYESSPLSRESLNMGAGNSWAGSSRGVGKQYLFNTSTDAAVMWTITSNPLPYDNYGNADVNVNTNIPVAGSSYNPGALYKVITTNEQGNVSVEYQDKNGNVILKKVQNGTIPADYSGYTNWLCTYYIYDDLSQLRFIISPKAVAAISGSSWNLGADTALINQCCFRYEYDDHRRMSAQKIPGAGWKYTVYDQRDRQVFTQDANMRLNNQWLTMLYDGVNRNIIIGMTTAAINPISLQSTVNTQTLPLAGDVNSSLQPNVTLSMPTTGTQQASNSITMTTGFSANGATGTFIAEILNATSGFGTSTVVGGLPVNNDPIPGGYSFLALIMNFYDNYDWTSKQFTAIYNNAIDAGTNTHPETIPSQASVHTTGLQTGTKVLTLENPGNLALGSWLATADFYDNRGMLVQIQSDNYRGGADTTTKRYDFKGKVIGSYLAVTDPAAGANGNIRIKFTTNYDAAERTLQEYSTVNDDNTTHRLLAQFTYDHIGQQSQRQLGQKQDLSFLETQDFTYNIRGWLKAINKDYANNDNSRGANNRWFGLELSYDWGFANNRYNGDITGTKWRTKGDGQQRAYGFGYDLANRLLAGDFSQYDGTSGAYTDNSVVNFDMMMGDGINGSSAYDASGNIQVMKQWGLKGTSSSLIDDLVYTYNTSSNKLKNVIDNQNDATTTLGDFRTSSHSPYYTNKTSSAVDYNYDANGNLTRDLNKDIGTLTADGIVYNHLNLPYQVTVQSGSGVKGTITYVYDAAGNKLKKTTVDNVAGVQTTTLYINGLVYQSRQSIGASPADTLQFISTVEGRIRPVQPSISGQPAITYTYDYFLKDHLGNTRMVLTEQQQQDIYPAATLEGNNTPATDPVTVEEAYYSINTSQIVSNSMATGITSYQNNNGNPPVNNNPNCNNTSPIKQTDLSQKVYEMNAASTAKTGLGITLKVMSGDRLDIFGLSYYTQLNTGGSGANASMAALDIINGLLGTPGSPAAEHVTAAQMNANTIGTVTPLNAFIQNHDNPAAETTPRAYINYVFFDDLFNYAGSGASQVQSPNSVTDHYRVNQLLNNITAPKNGYVYVFCSNESPANVFFDNLQVILTHGPLTEENHYYPFGLTMAGISDKSLQMGYTQNQFRFNGKELQNKEFADGSGLEWYDYGARMYDPQIGRWLKTDNKAQLYQHITPYAYAANQPTHAVDPDGNLVIFINGFTTSRWEKGTQWYWRDYRLVRVYGKTVPGLWYIPSHFEPRQTGKAYDDEMAKQLGAGLENKHYVDGEVGYIGELRELFGIKKGYEEAASLIAGLHRTGGVIDETIKIITHSMGGVFGDGYVRGIKQYLQEHPELAKQVKITLVVDLDPFEASLIYNDGTIKKMQFLHTGKGSGTGWLANETERGIFELIHSTTEGSHSLPSFEKEFHYLKEGTYNWNDKTQQWEWQNAHITTPDYSDDIN